MLQCHRSKRLKVLQCPPMAFKNLQAFRRGFAGWENLQAFREGFAGWETLKCFEIPLRRQKGAKEHEGRKKPLVSCFSLSRRRRISCFSLSRRRRISGCGFRVLLVAGFLFRPGGRGPPRLLENASGFCYASMPSLQTPEGFTRPPDGFQKPSSVSQGLCGMGNLEAFWKWRLSGTRING